MSTVVNLGPGSGGFGSTQIDIFITETGSDISGQQQRQMNSMLCSFSPRDWNTVTFNSGNNVLTPPTGNVVGMFFLQMPSDNVIAVNFEGKPIAPNGSVTLGLNNANLPANYTVNCANAISGVRYAWV